MADESEGNAEDGPRDRDREPSSGDEPATAPDAADESGGQSDAPGSGADADDADGDGRGVAADGSDDSGSGEATDVPDESDGPAGSDSPAGEGDAAADPEGLQTDGEGYVGDRPAEEPSYPDPGDDVGGISTPPDDEEMPLADHIEEMILRLAVVLLFGSAATAVGLLGASEAISIIWTDIFPGVASEIPPPHVYHPLELWLTRIKVAALLGILVALPVFVYECYLFMRPGLYPNERKYYLAAVPTSLVLAVLGMVFSYLLVLPVLFQYFTLYSDQSADIAYALGETFDLVITLTGFLAIVFQIPLFIMLAIMMGVTTRRWLAQKRLYFWAAFAVLAFTFTIDPTLMAAILVAITMIALFEGTLALLKWTGRE